MKKIFSIILLISITGIRSQNIQTNSGLQNALSAYGYLLGQEYVLNKIKVEFPELKSNIFESELMFKISFGKAKENLESHFLSKFSSEQFNDYQAKLIEEIIKLNFTIDSQEKAEQFLEEIKNRAKGQIASPTKEILLFYQFENNPEEEFLKGFTQKFKTKGHEKSKGTDWSLKVPISWVAKEADRPNIIQKFISEGGIGNESIMLMVKDLPNNISKAEIESFFTEQEIKNMIPEGGKFLQFKKMVFDNVNGGLLEYEDTAKRLDYRLSYKSSNFLFIYNNKLYSIQCSVGALSTEYKEDQKDKFSKLFKLVANSIVIDQQYKK